MTSRGWTMISAHVMGGRVREKKKRAAAKRRVHNLIEKAYDEKA